MLRAYKWYIAGFLVYSLGLWHVCKTYTESGHRAEVIKLQRSVIDTQEQRAKLASDIGTAVEQKLAALTSTQTTINQKVIREIVKEPVYSDCLTTPNGMQLIEAAIDAKGSSSK